MNVSDFKRLICNGFCEGMQVSQSGDLLNVSVPFDMANGDVVTFYIVPAGNDCFRIEDDGGFVPPIIASGVNLLEGHRSDEFKRILDSCGLTYDVSTGELAGRVVKAEDLSDATFNFISAIMKIEGMRSPNAS